MKKTKERQRQKDKQTREEVKEKQIRPDGGRTKKKEFSRFPKGFETLQFWREI